MRDERFWLKSGFLAAALATAAWIAVPAAAQESEGEEPTEATEPELPETTGRAVSEAAKTLKDLPPEERAAFARTLRQIAQENLPEAALQNRPEQAGQGPLNKPDPDPETADVTETTDPQTVDPETGEPVAPELPETTGRAVSEVAKTLKDLPPEEVPEVAKTLREVAQENLPEQALTNRAEQAGLGPLNRPETAGPPVTTSGLRPTKAGRPTVRPTAASRPQRPQRPARPQRPGRGRN
jgi:hypothetical protein